MKFFILFVWTLNTLSAQDLPNHVSSLFAGSGNCSDCHAPGLSNPQALRNSLGDDISPVTLWRSTMMANAAKDPYWRAKVSTEVLENPHLKTVIEDKCLTCHSPMARTQAIYDGQEHYTFEEMKTDGLALDGVSCTVCHQITDSNFGSPQSFSGNYIIEDSRLIYGPYDDMDTFGMEWRVDYTPVMGDHIRKSELCATCHTLFTPVVNDDGDIIKYAPEQTPYLEWKNSIYPEQDIQCQSCHVPLIADSVAISSEPATLDKQFPYGLHYFVGGNSYMLNLLKTYKDEINVTASDDEFDATIARTEELLKNETVDLQASYNWTEDYQLQVKVAVKNRAGHKFPTGYPARRAWLYLELTDEQNFTLFESGQWDNSGEIIGLDTNYEQHYDTITTSNQVQIYESVMQDVNGQVTFVLLRAADYLKDNRIPPEGFLKNGIHYDSTAIVGNADWDENFNLNASGVDSVTYLLSGFDISKSYSASIKMFYQSLKPRDVSYLFQYDTDEVNTFKQYFNALPNMPVEMENISLNIESTKVPDSFVLVDTYPNPFNPDMQIKLTVLKDARVDITIYNALGEQVKKILSQNLTIGNFVYSWDAMNLNNQKVNSGLFFVAVRYKTSQGNTKSTIKKVLYLK